MGMRIVNGEERWFAEPNPYENSIDWYAELDRERERLELVRSVREARERQARERERAARVRNNLATLMPLINGGSVDAMRRYCELLEAEHGITAEFCMEFPAGASAYAVWNKRHIVVPHTVDAITFAIRLHEDGHILAGPCPQREPHRPDPKERRWHHCIACEVDAWEKAMSIAPFSREMHTKLRRSLETYRRTTPAATSQVGRLDRLVSDGAYADSRLKWLARRDREARLERAQRELEAARRRLGCQH